MTRADDPAPTAAWMNGPGRPDATQGPPVDEQPTVTGSGRSEDRPWRVYAVGGAARCLQVRFHDDAEVPDWRRGPALAAALKRAATDGWHVYDSEPGGAPGERAIIHLKRSASR